MNPLSLHTICKYAPVPRHERPLLAGLAAEMIAQAFHVAQRGDTSHQNFGRLTPVERRYSRLASAHAIRWIRAHTNWTRISLETRLRAWGSAAPPREVRDEYAGSFDWCCELLNLDPDETRRNGCPIRADHKSRWLIRGGLANWREWRATRGGAHAVYREKADIALKALPLLQEEAKARKIEALKQNQQHSPLPPHGGNGNGEASDHAAKLVGIGRNTVDRAKPRTANPAINFCFQFGHDMPAQWRPVPIVSAPCRISLLA